MVKKINSNESIQARAKLQSAVVDQIMEDCNLKNSAAVSRTMKVAAPIVSKWRSGQTIFGATYIIRMHELTGRSVRSIKESLGLKIFDKYQSKA